MKVITIKSAALSFLFVLLAYLLLSLNSPTRADTFSGVSGFAYQSVFSNNEFRENTNKVALNGYVHTDIGNQPIELFTQIATNRPASGAINRLSAALPIKLHPDNESGIRLGKFNRVMGFYNDISDAPSTSGQTVNPQSSYNSRFLTASFATMTGLQLYSSHFFDKGVLYADASVGELEMGDQTYIQNLLLKKALSKIELVSPKDNWALFTKWDGNGYTALYEHSFYDIRWEQIAPFSPMAFPGSSDFISKIIISSPQPWLDAQRVGLSVDLFDYTLSSEKYWLKSGSGVGNSQGLYWIVKRPAGEYEVFLGRASVEVENFPGSSDNFIGVSRNMGDWFFNVEYHDLTGKGWSMSNKEDTDSFAASVVYRF
jgi:hypothetical protein